MSLKLGKLPASYSKKDLLFEDFVTVPRGCELPQAGIGFGDDRLLDDWGMLGNDRYGDCAWAGPAHEHMLWTKLGTGVAASFTDENVLSDYAACTGFDPATGANDNGTDMRNGLDYRRHIGIIDAQGHRHQIGGYAALEPGNWDQVLMSLYIFDAVAVGIEFPTSAMDQFGAGKPWSVVHGATIDGGHYVPVIGRPHSRDLFVVTWGKTQMMTRGFYHKYNDEAYGLFSVETLKNGKSPEGFNLQDFTEALKEI